MLDIVWAFMKGMRNTLIPIAAAVVGLVLGLLIGWGTASVTNQAPVLLSEGHQSVYLNGVAALYATSGDNEFINSVALAWDNEADGQAFLQEACQEIQALNDAGRGLDAQRLTTVVTALGGSCGAIEDGAEVESGSFLQTCLYGLLLLAALGGVFYFLRARQGGDQGGNIDFTMPSSKPTSVPDAPPTMEGGDDGGGVSEGITPIASYRTSYKIGFDQYDDSFSIESASGDFLGECGVGISESLGGDGPKKATAMEVWLFDKNDIRTITKVVMSDHAFFDEAIKAKLAPKGEPVMARLDEVVVLETASLIINAKITELEYGDDPNYPDQSYFERFGIELSAWSKDDGSAAGSGDASFNDMF